MSSLSTRQARRSRAAARCRAWLRSGAAASALVMSLAGCRSDATLAWLGRETVAPDASSENAATLAWRSRGETPWTVARVDPSAEPVRIPAATDSPAEVRLAGYQPAELPAARADDAEAADAAEKTSRRGSPPKVAVPHAAAPEVVSGARPMADPASRPMADPASRPMADPASRPVLELENKAPYAVAAPEPLALRRVVESVYTSFPAMEAALREFDIAAGKQQSAWGEFDLKLKAESISQPEGYYDNYRNLVKLEQALMSGGGVFGQYRIGDGSYPEYYRDRETNEGGEFKVGWETPLLRGRRIDGRRAEIFQTTIRRQQVDPEVQSLLLEFTFGATDAYWSWVAAGLSYDAQRDLLRVTVERNKQFEERVKVGDLAEIELVQNERLIASREAKVIEAERKLQQAAIKLSLYLRDDQGQPIMPAPTMLPANFPEPTPPDLDAFPLELDQALAQRPELRELDFQREQYEVDLALGENLRLPGLNAMVVASKDVGAPATKKGDKTPFELEAGLMFDLPLQRRKADGKIQEAQGKLAQLAAKREFTANKIANQVQDAQSALATSYERVGRARRNVVLARRLEAAERLRFEAEDSDLLRVALQEAAEIEATLLEIETLADYFKAAAALRAATAVDPLANP